MHQKTSILGVIALGAASFASGCRESTSSEIAASEARTRVVADADTVNKITNSLAMENWGKHRWDWSSISTFEMQERVAELEELHRLAGEDLKALRASVEACHEAETAVAVEQNK